MVHTSGRRTSVCDKSDKVLSIFISMYFKENQFFDCNRQSMFN